MTFADPGTCLSCRGTIEQGMSTCPHCGVDLASHEIQQAWRALVVADQWVAKARGHDDPSPTEEPAQSAPRAPRLSAGTILLVLGAVSLLVAGLIFITVSWGSLGIVGRALALLAFTSVVGGIAHFLTRRSLRASGEALWTVFLGLLTLDWFAARGQGLFGLDALPGGYATGVWGVAILAAGVAIAKAGREPLGVTLVAPAIAAGAAPIIGAGGVAAEVFDDQAFWWGFATCVAAGAVTLLHRRLGLRPAAIVAAVGTGILAVFAVLAALVDAVDHPSLRQLVLERHGVPLTVVAVSAALAAAVGRGRIRSIAAALFALSVATLAVLPTEHAWPMRGGLVVGALAVLVFAVLAAGTGAWARGLRWAAAFGAVVVALWATPYAARLIEVAGAGAFGTRQSALAQDIALEWYGQVRPWWVPLVVAAALSGSLLRARLWPEFHGRAALTKQLPPAAATVAAFGLATAVASPIPPAVSLGSSLVLIGGCLTFVNRSAPLVWRHLGSAVVAIAPLTTLTSWVASLIVWPLAALVLLANGWRESDSGVRWAERGFAAWWISLVPGIAMAQDGRSARTVGIAIVATGALVLIATSVRDRSGTRSVGAADLGTGAAGLIGLLVASAPGWTSLPWTVAGAGVTIAGLANLRRRWCRWAGPGMLGIAYIIRLADTGVDVVEAYTAPFAVAVLAVGLWAMRRSAVGSMRALAAGVTLALLPSLPQALIDPTSLRALLLGLVAVGFLGVGLSCKWRAPFVGGAAVVLLLVLANIGPWALGLPRWMLFCTLGVVAIGIGATWESRVRDGRAVASYVSHMR